MSAPPRGEVAGQNKGPILKFRTLLSKFCQLRKQLIHVPNIILGAVGDDGDYDGDDGDNDYDGD